jgi:DNA-binding IclR family transcriptional regulator
MMMGRKTAKAERARITAKVEADPKRVKSAGRVLEILEFFDDVQRESTVMEIAETLGYPQSSTSALLRSLVDMGYLIYAPTRRTYITSNRVALLGSWMNSDFFREGAIISMMKELNEETRDTVVLATRNGLYVQYIHVIQATNPARLHITLGTARPLAASSAGYAMLSTLKDEEVRRIVMRINAEAAADEPLLKIADILARLAEIRVKGYAFTQDLVTRGGGMISAPLPRVDRQPQMVVGIGGISEVMRNKESELAAALIGQIDKRFGTQSRLSVFAGRDVRDPFLDAIRKEKLQAS